MSVIALFNLLFCHSEEVTGILNMIHSKTTILYALSQQQRETKKERKERKGKERKGRKDGRKEGRKRKESSLSLIRKLHKTNLPITSVKTLVF